MKILVINEPFVKDFCRTQRWAAKTRGRVLRAPDWLAYAAAVLEDTGFNVKLFDMVACGQDKEDFRAIVRSENPDFVVLDSTTPSIYSDIECARIAKDVSSSKVIMVGPHVSALPEDTLKSAQGAVDIACIGEYDYTVRDVVKNFHDLGSVPGIAYYEQGRAIRTAKRELINDLDKLPFPAWRHLDLMKYFDGGKLYPYIDIISGRGCPNGCTFCLWPQVMHGQGYRLRSAENVIAEIEYDIDLCPRVLKGGEFFFEDDTFTVQKDRAMNICEEIMCKGLKINFSVNARADNADLGLFKVMKKAGCRELLVGFESGAQSQLDRMNKRVRLEQSRLFMAYAKEARLEVHGCFVIGLPGETEETARDTINFALSLGLTTAQFSGAVPFPGTAFFSECSNNGWLGLKDWSSWLDNGEQRGVVNYPQLSGKRIDHYVDQGLKEFYFRPQYILGFALNTRSSADMYRKLRGMRNFVSYLLQK